MQVKGFVSCHLTRTFARERLTPVHFSDVALVLPYDMERRRAPSKALCRDNPVGMKKLGIDEAAPPRSNVSSTAVNAVPFPEDALPGDEGEVGAVGESGENNALGIKDKVEEVLIEGGGDWRCCCCSCCCCCWNTLFSDIRR